MSSLIWSPVYRALERQLETGDKLALLVVPFIKVEALKQLMWATSVSKNLKVVVRWLPQDLIAGVSDLEVYRFLKSQNIPLYFNNQIHLKLYTFESNLAFNTSGNLTLSGLGYAEHGNIEVGNLVTLDLDDWAQLYTIIDQSIQVDDHVHQDLSDALNRCDKPLLPSPTVSWPSWGHLLDDNEQSCSPECDIIIHKKGYVRKWNGNAAPIMEFHFVKASNVLAVVSCKSKAAAIDKRYPKDLETFGVKDIFLFAECCRQKDFKKLEAQARKAGYKGFWSLYFADDDGPGFQTDETQYQDFGKRVLGAVISRRKATPQPRSREQAQRPGRQAAASNARRTSVRPKFRTKR